MSHVIQILRDFLTKRKKSEKFKFETNSNSHFASTDQVLAYLQKLCEERENFYLFSNVILTSEEDVSLQLEECYSEFCQLPTKTKFGIIVVNGAISLGKEAHQNIFILDVDKKLLVRCEPMGVDCGDEYHIGYFSRSLRRLICYKSRYAYRYDINDNPACRVTSLILALMYIDDIPFSHLSKIDHFGEISLMITDLLKEYPIIKRKRRKR